MLVALIAYRYSTIQWIMLDKSHVTGEMRILLHCSSTVIDLKLTIIGLPVCLTS